MSCGLWSAQQLTDGVIPADVVEDEGGSPAEAQLLTDANLWHAAGHTCPRCPEPPEGGYVFHDWRDYQPTREKVLATRKATAERVTQFRARKAAGRNSVTTTVTTGGRNAVTTTVTDAGCNAVTTALVTPPPTRRVGKTLGVDLPRSVVTSTDQEQDQNLLPARCANEPDDTVEAEVIEVEAAPGPKQRRGTRLPDGWEPSEALLAWVREKCPGLRRSENEKFVDYWRAQPGQRGVKIDWDATWRNWMRSAFERSPAGRDEVTLTPRGHPAVPPRMQALQQSIAGLSDRVTAEQALDPAPTRKGITR